MVKYFIYKMTDAVIYLFIYFSSLTPTKDYLTLSQFILLFMYLIIHSFIRLYFLPCELVF